MGAMNELINEATVMRLVHQLTEAGADALPHVIASATELGDLNLRARSDLVSAALLADLGDYASIAALFRRALLHPDFGGWIIWPVGETVTTAALRDDAFDDALALQAELTPRLSSEFAIRRLLAHDLTRALPVIQTWTQHPNEHVRRLASEGTRSYLPWAIRVPSLLAHPDATIPLLEASIAMTASTCAALSQITSTTWREPILHWWSRQPADGCAIPTPTRPAW